MGAPTLSRVIWSEGMHLAQHHFQAQNRYFESVIQFALSHVFHGTYGVLRLELDQDALWNGSVSVLAATGVMPDGLAFDLPDSDPAPQSRDLSALLGTAEESRTIHLAIPAYRPRDPNCSPEGASDGDGRRFRSESRPMFDETTGADQRTVEVERKNFRVVLESELDDGMVSLPIARVKADETSHFVYDAAFVPPCLQIGASPRLTGMLTRLVDMLESKASTLRSQRAAPSAGGAGFASHELASFWLSHAVYSALGPLRHHLGGGRSHPELLYEEMIRLAGALCTFSLESNAAELPSYDHDHPENVFPALDRHIRDHLAVVIPESFLSMPLVPSEAHLHSGPVRDQRVLGASEWILRIKSSAPDAKIIRDVPRLLKVCSAEDVMRLVADANPGLPVEHILSPPSSISPRVGSHYFRVRQDGPSWKLILARSTVGVYVPDAFPDAEVEVLVIPE